MGKQVGALLVWSAGVSTSKEGSLLVGPSESSWEASAHGSLAVTGVAWGPTIRAADGLAAALCSSGIDGQVSAVWCQG